MNDDEILAAKSVAWGLYVQRLRRLVNEQYQAWNRGQQPSLRLMLDVPTPEDVEAIRQALTAVRIAASTSSLGTLTRALDAIDNSKSKHATVKAVRAELQALHDELYRVKAAGAAPAQRAQP